MKKVAIVGVEGSGKTVMLAGLGYLYTNPDEEGYFLSPKSFSTAAYVSNKIARMRRGEWPSATAGDEMKGLDWTLKRRLQGERQRPEVVCEVSFLDFAGEVYRTAFGIGTGDGAFAEQAEELKRYVREADDLIVLINLRDVIVNGIEEPRVQEAAWITKAILDAALTEEPGHSVPRAAIVLSQADSYADTIGSCGGVAGVLKKYLPYVSNDYGWLDVLAASAVDKTILDADGNVVPSPDFTASGLQPIIRWILGNDGERTGDDGRLPSRTVRPAGIDAKAVEQLLSRTASQHGCDDFFFPSSPKFQSKLSNMMVIAKEKFNRDISPEDVIALLDCTVFGSAKNGVLFDRSGLYVFNDWAAEEQSGFISWGSFFEYGNVRKGAWMEVHLCDSPAVGVNLAKCDLNSEQAIPLFIELQRMAGEGR